MDSRGASVGNGASFANGGSAHNGPAGYAQYWARLFAWSHWVWMEGSDPA